MKKILILTILSIITIVHSYAADVQKLIRDGNTYYTKNEFDKAINQYQAVLKEGYSSSELYFNLGNAYFKSKNTIQAILYYEKAQLLAPADKDITFNLELAKSYTIDKIEAIPEVFLITWFKAIRNLLDLNKWTFLSIIAFIVTLTAFLIFLLSNSIALKKISFWLGAVILIFTIGSFGCAYSHYSAQTNHKTAIIFAPSVNIKSSPSDTGNNLFVLHEGTKVELLEKVGEWCEIKISSGGRGYIKLTDLEVI